MPHLPRSMMALSMTAVLALASCSPTTSRYELATAEVGDVTDAIVAPGRVEYPGMVEVRASVDAIVDRVLVKPGEQVTRGQILVSLVSDASDAELSAAKADAKVAAIAVLEARKALERDAQRLASQQRLHQSGFISDAALGASERDVELSELGVRKALAGSRAAEVRLAGLETHRRGRAILSPIAGVVLDLPMVRGQAVSPGAAAPKITIAPKSDQVLINARVAEADLGRVAPGQKVDFTVDADSGRTFAARVQSRAPLPVSEGPFQTYGVLLIADNPDGFLLPGMTATVQFYSVDARSVLRMPATALYFQPLDYKPVLPKAIMEEGRKTGLEKNEGYLYGAEMALMLVKGYRRVFVLSSSGRWERRLVRIGRHSEDYVEVLEGLRAGEQVIVEDRKRLESFRTGV